MMKRLATLLTAALLLLSCALAESLTLGDYTLPVPRDVTIEKEETTVTLVRQGSRVVVQALPQEIREDGAQQVQSLMTVYRKDVTEIQPLTLLPGIYGAKGIIRDCFGDGEDQLVVLVLSDSGLLVLSAYDLNKDNKQVDALLTELLQTITLAGKPLMIP